MNSGTCSSNVVNTQLSQLHGSYFYSSFISSIFRNNFTINSFLALVPDVSY